MQDLWHKRNMNDVGNSTLAGSPELIQALKVIGCEEAVAAQHLLFAEDDANDGVFLILRGKVRLRVKDLAKLDRTFAAGSLLGLPSTFTRKPYSLTGVAVTDCNLLHVPAERFLALMRERPDLCRQAAEMLCRETSFIQSALAERRRYSLSVH